MYCEKGWKKKKKLSKFCLLIVHFIFAVCVHVVVVSSWELPVRLEEDLYKNKIV